MISTAQKNTSRQACDQAEQAHDSRVLIFRTPRLQFIKVFGSSSSSSSSLALADPEIIHHRSHSFVGPSPRFARSNSLPFWTIDQSIDSESSEDDIEDEAKIEGEIRADLARKIGPGAGGKGAFGKLFQVRKRDGDGIFEMKVMRKETIIKNNLMDYMKAERDRLTKVVHPFIVQLRYSFQE